MELTKTKIDSFLEKKEYKKTVLALNMFRMIIIFIILNVYLNLVRFILCIFFLNHNENEMEMQKKSLTIETNTPILLLL